MKSFAAGLLVYFITTLAAMSRPSSVSVAQLVDLSQQLLLQAKTHEPTDSLVAVLKQVSAEQLTAQLTTDDYKKAFWINLYNAFTQIILTKNPDNIKTGDHFLAISK